MNKLKRVLLFATFLCLISIASHVIADANNKLTYFGTNNFKITNDQAAKQYQLGLFVYNLDALHNLEASIRENLPEDPDEAIRIGTERMNALDESVTEGILIGSVLLLKWDIKKLPAFVFGDGKFVVYGVTDTNAAIKYFLNSRSTSTEY